MVILKEGLLIGGSSGTAVWAALQAAKELKPSDNCLVLHKPFYAHAFKALKKSSMLAFVNGKRGGKKYELDTYRLEKKLI